ncbi:MAG: hypothetical protein IRY85_20345 [Micromonosporaceae bacterium]|nr:hypothetical protein [Micromonosporaceae bacterium]
MDISSLSAVAAAKPADGSWVAPLDVTTYVVYAVALLLLTSVILFIKVVFFNKRPQKMALVFMLLAVPLYLIYYDDRIRNLIPRFEARSWAGPLVSRWSATERFDANFHSDITPAIMVGIILLFHMIVLQRLAARERLQRIANLTSTFFAGSTAATMLGGTIVSTFHLGWQGAVGIGVGFALIYLGALALFAALVELLAALAELAWVWIKRQVFKIATLITRAANWISSLGGRLVSRALIERIRAETAAQEGQFLKEQDDQDQRLIEAYIHDLERKRQARLKAMREKYGDEDSIAELRALIAPKTAAAAEADKPSAPAPSTAAEDYGTPPPPRDPFETAAAPAAAASSSSEEPTTQQQPQQQ